MGECTDYKKQQGGSLVVEEMVHGVGKGDKEEDAQKCKEIGLVLVEDDGGGG